MWRYIWREQGTYILIYFLLLLLTLAGVGWMGANAVLAAADLWSKLSAWLSLAAIGVSLPVWFANTKKSWQDSLPMRLDAIYLHYQPGEAADVLAACLDASLSGESDIRAMAQQMAAQIFFDGIHRNLVFLPQFDILPAVVDRRANCVRYVIRMYFQEIPESLRGMRASDPTLGLLRHHFNGKWCDERVPKLHDYQRVQECLQLKQLDLPL